MTVTFNADAETTNGTAGTSVVVSRPAAATAGELLLAFIDTTGTPSITAPAGWNLIASQDSTGMRSAAYWRPAAPGDPASWTWTLGSSQRNLGYIAALPGANTADPILDYAVTADTTAGTSWSTSPPPEITTGAGAVGHAAAVRTASGVATTWTVNSGTERADLSTNAGAGTDIAGAVAVGAYTGVPPGVYLPTFTSSQSCDAGVVWAITIRPAFIGYDAATLAVPIVEAAFGADPDGDPELWTWTNVTRYVTDAGISMSAGAQDAAGQSSSTRVRLAFHNADGTMAPDNPNSIYYPHLREDLPIRVSVPYGYGPDTELATVFVAKFTESWDESEDHAIVSVDAQGRWDRVQGKHRPVRSTLHRTIKGPSAVSGATPHAYYPLEDGSGATRAASAFAHNALIAQGPASFGSASDLAGSAPLPVFAENGKISGALGPAYTGTGTWTVAMVAKLPVSPGSTQRIFTVENYGSARYWQLVMSPGTPDTFRIQSYSFGGTLLVDNSVAVTESDIYGNWLLFAITVTQNGANVDYDGSYFSADSGVTVSGTLNTNTVGALRYFQTVAFAAWANMAVGHIAAWVDPSFDHSELASVAFAALDGQADETPADRWSRVTTEEGLYATVVEATDATEITMGAQPVGKLADILRETEAVDQGLIHDNGRLGQLVLVTRASRYNADPSITIDNRMRRLARGFEPTKDASERIAQATVKRSGGSSATFAAAESGREDEQTYNLHTDDHLYELAGFRAGAANARGRRYARLGFDLRQSPELLEAWLNTSLGDRVQAVNLPAIHAPSGEMADGFIEGYSQQITGERWTVDLVCSPAEPYLVAVVEATDDSVWRVETDGAHLLTTASASAVSLLVGSTSDTVFTTAVADFPVDVEIGGEQIEISAISHSLAEGFDHAASNGWGTPDSSFLGQPWTVTGTASEYSTTGSVGRMQLVSANDLHFAHVDTGATDHEVLAAVVVPVLPTGASFEQSVGVRFADVNNYYSATLAIATTGVVTLQIFRRVATVGAAVSSSRTLGLTHSAGNQWWINLAVLGDDLMARAWKSTEPRPGAWQVVGTDTNLTTGTRIAALARRNTGNLNGSTAVDWPEVAVVNPQTFTVAERAKNGVVKAHASGAPVTGYRIRPVAL